MSDLNLDTCYSINSIESEILTAGLAKEAKTAKGLNSPRFLSLMLKDSQQNIQGGLTAQFYYGCIYIDQLWVTEKCRGQGFGSKLLKQAEELAKKENCRFVTICTMDWEAEAFYQKHGYFVEFIRDGYHANSKMIFMRKNL